MSARVTPIDSPLVQYNESQEEEDHIPNPLHEYEVSNTKLTHDSSLPPSTPHTTQSQPLYIQMFQWDKIGLYCHYSGVGLIMASINLVTAFCYYYYKGSPNICANSWSIIVIPWGMKIFYAVLTDSYHPFGSRRKVYMVFGWVGVLLLTAVLAITADSITTLDLITISLLIQACLMLADTAADGLSVEIGRIEPLHEQGQVMATGQRLRYVFTILGSFLQSFLLNGPITNPPDCTECWEWGLSPSQYYLTLTLLLAIITLPLIFFHEKPSHTLCTGKPSFARYTHTLWQTLQNPTTLYLLLFAAGNNSLSLMSSVTQW